MPMELVRYINDYASGNPKQLMEIMEPMLCGYHTPSEYVTHGDERTTQSSTSAQQWLRPALKIVGNHQLEVLVADLGKFPWPSKMVGFTEQTFQDEFEQSQHVLHVASSFEHGYDLNRLRILLARMDSPDCAVSPKLFIKT